jgi:type I restriction enzyme S subunit
MTIPSKPKGIPGAQVDTLTPLLLARAFAGQLIPQNPKDEPASALLERIKVRS